MFIEVQYYSLTNFFVFQSLGREPTYPRGILRQKTKTKKQTKQKHINKQKQTKYLSKLRDKPFADTFKIAVKHCT